MSAPSSHLVLLVDALGWLTVERTGFLTERLPFRRRLTTVFGYSSTAIPSLITGAWPREHGHWFLFKRADGRSPFQEAAWLDRLPGGWGRRWRVRMKLQEYWRRKAGIKGYFSIYNTPFSTLAEMAPVEQLDTWAPGSFPGTPSLVDYLHERQEPFFLSDWRRPDREKLVRARAAVSEGAPRTVVLYLTEIDALQHRVGTQSPELDRALRELSGELETLIAAMETHGPVGVSLFSDHGMTDITEHRDLVGALAQAGFVRNRDYRGFFDSTVGRFWQVRDPKAFTAALNALDWGTVLGADTLSAWRVDFPKADYGDIFFLARPGALILPSDMGAEPLAAMHGYDPADPTSDACFLADRPVDLSSPHITAVWPALRRRLDGGE